MPDSSAIDAALVATLRADPELAALLPDGIYMDVAPPHRTRFAIVSLIVAEDDAAFGGRAIEDVRYLIKAVMNSKAGDTIDDAAARIDAVLEDAPVTAAGYAWMTLHRDERVRYTEVDDVDPTIRWYHRGGRYRLQVATTDE